VGNAEGLVQVEVGYVRTVVTGAAEHHLGLRDAAFLAQIESISEIANKLKIMLYIFL
jgi:hypothetical protein